MNSNLTVISFLLMYTLSGFYFVRYGYSFSYVGIITGLLIYFFSSAKRFRLNIKSFNLLHLCFGILLIFNAELSGAYVNLVLGVLCFCVTMDILHRQNALISLKIINVGIVIAILLILIDTYVRIAYPIIDYDALSHYIAQGTEFYIYKFNSVLFADSNSVAFMCLSFQFLSLILYTLYKRKKYFCYTLILGILSLLTFSRSALIANAIGVLYYLNRKFLYKHRGAIIASLILILFLIVFLYNDDESFTTKIYIYKSLLQSFYDNNIMTILFGVGLSNFFYQYNIAAHSLYVTMFAELGFFFGIIAFYLLYRTFVKSEYTAAYLIPLLVCGISFFPYVGLPFMYMNCAIVCWLTDQKNAKNI